MGGQTKRIEIIRKSKSCVGSLFIFLAVLVSVSHASAKEILLATDLTRALNQLGLPIVECVFEKIELSHQVISVPWSRAQAGTRSGSYDEFFVAAKSANRESFAVHSEPLLNIEWLYVVGIDSGLDPDDASFFQKSFGANLGTARYAWLIEQYQNGKFSKEIVATSSPLNSLKMLSAGRIDVNLENNIILQEKFRTAAVNAAEFKTFSVAQMPAGIYFGKDFLSENPRFLSKFNASLEKCRKL